jgi:hypothetical protein
VAYACPSCGAAKTVVVLFGVEGSFPYPCLRCAWVPRWLPTGTEQRANEPCPTRACLGSVCLVYLYDAGGELLRVGQEPCARCRGGGVAEHGTPHGVERHQNGTRLSAARWG